MHAITIVSKISYEVTAGEVAVDISTPKKLKSACGKMGDQ